MFEPSSVPLRRLVWIALALSLGAAVSLGITRFAYGLLLPVMREDLDWGYTLAGAMNTANAGGYLLGALATPWLLRRFGSSWVLLAGVASAFVFVAGRLLAARLGAQAPQHAGLLLGLYYGGTGWGISASALAVPGLLRAAADVPHGWSWAWWGLALLCLLATLVLWWPASILQKS